MRTHARPLLLVAVQQEGAVFHKKQMGSGGTSGKGGSKSCDYKETREDKRSNCLSVAAAHFCLLVLTVHGLDIVAVNQMLIYGLSLAKIILPKTSDKILMQTNFTIQGLIPEHANIKSRIWLKKDEILLQKKDKYLHACVLTQESKDFMTIIDNKEMILPFLRILSLLTSNTITLQGYGGNSLKSKQEFGKEIKRVRIREIDSWSEKELTDIKTKTTILIRHMKLLHKKYIDIINENVHLKIALACLYESDIKSCFSNEGFVQIVTGIESLYGDDIGDIKYRLSCRSAFLLGLIPERPEEPRTIFDNMKAIYSQRSRLVHDGIIKKPPLMGQVARDYLRRSLIVMIILHQNWSGPHKIGPFLPRFSIR